MDKIAFQTFSVHHFNQLLNFKSNSIFFDKIFIHSSFFDAVLNSEPVQTTIKLDQPNLIKENYHQIEYLIEKGILSVYRPVKKISPDEIDDELKNELDDFFKLDELLKNMENKREIPFEQYLEICNLYFDYVTRFSCKELKLQGYNDIYPLLASKKSFANNSNKQEVLSFVLNKLPQPSPDTSWEQIIDFKSDPDSKSKYLALIQWINKTASTKRPINEVEDEY